MTLTPKLYDEINKKIISTLEGYETQMSQYDMLVIAINLLVSYMEVLAKIDLIPKDKIYNDVVQMMKDSFNKSFVSKN